MMGKQIQLVPHNGRRRTKPGAIALLNAIYPPQLVPPAHLFDEVYDIAKEYNMTLLIEKVKLGIIKNCDLEPLVVAEGDHKFPDVVFNAFAEFSLDESKSLDGYSHLDTH